MNKKEPYVVPAVKRTFDILEFLAYKGEATFVEIYTELGLPKSSAYQLLSTIEPRGYVRRTQDGAKYCLGLRLYELGNLAMKKFDIRDEAIPVLKVMSEKTKLACHMAVLDENEGVYLTHIEGANPVRLNAWEGKRIPLHASAMGKALMAWEDSEKLEKIIRNTRFVKATNKTIISPVQLRKQLSTVREKGWALNDEEWHPSIRAIAAPVRDVNGKVVAAIDIIGLSSDLNDKDLPKYVKILLKSAHDISVRLGFLE
jgi:DNA-binding IclR family transcriptional regulator